MLWSITSATDRGNGSTVNSANCCLRLFSYTRTSRQVSPGTSRCLLSFTVNGTSTKFVGTRSVNASGPCPPVATSGGVPSSCFCAAVVGNLFGTAPSSVAGAELSPFESGVVPAPGVTCPTPSPCGLGASGIVCGFGPSGIVCCCGASCCASVNTGCPAIMHAKAPANTLFLTTTTRKSPIPSSRAFTTQSFTNYQTTSATSPPPSPSTGSHTNHVLLGRPPAIQSYFSLLSCTHFS